MILGDGRPGTEGGEAAKVLSGLAVPAFKTGPSRPSGDAMTRHGDALLAVRNRCLRGPSMARRGEACGGVGWTRNGEDQDPKDAWCVGRLGDYVIA
jgi:hypothetical protein